MSDRSYAAVTFYRCTPEQWTQIVPMLDNLGLDLDWGTFGDDDVQTARLILGEQFTVDEVRLGEMAEALAKVAEQFPDVVFFGMQEAKYEYAGDVAINTDLGFFETSVDQSGGVTLTLDDISGLAQRYPDDVQALVAAAGEMLGEKHFAEIERWREQFRPESS